MEVTDFAEKQTHYTGANNKVKWVLNNIPLLEAYLKECNFKPSELAKKLNISYSSVKRLLCSANLWNKTVIKKQNYKTGRKRTAIYDKFGYKYADSNYDYTNSRGERIRRFEHIVNAELKYGRSLKPKEVVHHIDLNKSNNELNNLIICEDNSNHRRLHGNLEKVAAKLIQLGIIKFDEKLGYYYE